MYCVCVSYSELIIFNPQGNKKGLNPWFDELAERSEALISSLNLQVPRLCRVRNTADYIVEAIELVKSSESWSSHKDKITLDQFSIKGNDYSCFFP